MIDQIEITKRAQKDLRKVPQYILKNFQRWALLIEDIGLVETRKIKGFHDEPLTGDRAGQRSARLSKSYRVFYCEMPDKTINIVSVLEVNRHDY
jgi:proteic killer suppression protein